MGESVNVMTIGPGWYRDWTTAWVGSLERQRRSPNTIKTWGIYVRELGAFLETEGAVAASDLTREHLHRWQDRIKVRLAPASQEVATTAVRSLLKWADREDRSPRAGLWMALEQPFVPEGLPRPLEPTDLTLILAHYTRAVKLDRQTLRDRALFWFLITTGCRISEALQVRVDQLRNGRLLITKKGGDEHLLVMSARAQQWVTEYLRARGRDGEVALWVHWGRYGVHALRAEQANEIWSALADKLGLPRFTSHQLKHTSVTELGELEPSDDAVVKHIGWKSADMMRRYRLLRDRRRQEMVDQLDRLLPEPPPEPPSRRGRRFRVVRGT